MKTEDMTREQLIEELTKLRQHARGSAYDLNGSLDGLIGNLSLMQQSIENEEPADMNLNRLNEVLRICMQMQKIAQKLLTAAMIPKNG